MAEDTTPKLEVNAPQEGALVGDEAVFGVDSPVETEVYTDTRDAQVVAERAPDADQVYVHEVSVQLDRFVTDPSSPEAVQIPDAGRGSLELPIHALDAGSPEDRLAGASKGKRGTPVSQEDREKAAAEGRTVGFESV